MLECSHHRHDFVRRKQDRSERINDHHKLEGVCDCQPRFDLRVLELEELGSRRLDFWKDPECSWKTHQTGSTTSGKNDRACCVR